MKEGIGPLVGKIGSKIRQLRLAQKMSQEKLAEELNVSVRQLHKYESGKNRISVEKLIKAAGKLGVDLNYFADEKIHIPNKNTSFQEVTAEQEKVVRICRNIHPDKLREIWINKYRRRTFKMRNWKGKRIIFHL